MCRFDGPTLWTLPGPSLAGGDWTRGASADVAVVGLEGGAGLAVGVAIAVGVAVAVVIVVALAVGVALALAIATALTEARGAEVTDGAALPIASGVVVAVEGCLASSHSFPPSPTKKRSVTHGSTERRLRRGGGVSTGSDGSTDAERSRSLSLSSIVGSAGGAGGGGGLTEAADGTVARGAEGSDGGGSIASSVRAWPSSCVIARRTSSRISLAFA